MNYDKLAAEVHEYRPKMLVCEASACLDYPRLRLIANSVGCYLVADISQISGLVATTLIKRPFLHCDIVTSATDNNLRGTRSGMIFHKVKHTEAINFAVFPMLQGGPHNVSIAALAVQLKEVAHTEFKKY